MKSRTFGTRIDLAPEARTREIRLLNQQLADTFDLYRQVKQAKWNVEGPDSSLCVKSLVARFDTPASPRVRRSTKLLFESHLLAGSGTSAQRKDLALA